jgi:hypothetical protein
VIRNAVIHINNEQPVVADLFELPSAGDAGLVCTNVRLVGGRRPTFVDSTDSTFFFPYLHIRFVEIPPGPVEGESRLPVPAGSRLPAPAADPEPEPEGELEIDLDFLQRVRDA